MYNDMKLCTHVLFKAIQMKVQRVPHRVSNTWSSLLIRENQSRREKIFRFSEKKKNHITINYQCRIIPLLS